MYVFCYNTIIYAPERYKEEKEEYGFYFRSVSSVSQSGKYPDLFFFSFLAISNSYNTQKHLQKCKKATQHPYIPAIVHLSSFFFPSLPLSFLQDVIYHIYVCVYTHTYIPIYKYDILLPKEEITKQFFPTFFCSPSLKK